MSQPTKTRDEADDTGRAERARALASSPQAPLFVLCAVVVAVGVYFRFVRLDFPNVVGLDEHLFLNDARNILGGRPDTNDHPPLGKMLMAAAMGMTRPDLFGGRLAQAILGALMIPVGFETGRRLFRSVPAGLIAALLLSIDGPLVAYSRVTLLDGILVTFMVIALFVALSVPRGAVVVAGLFVGFSAAVKLSGGLVGVPVALVLMTRQRSLARALLAPIGAALCAGGAYYLVGTLAGYLTHSPEPFLYAFTDTVSDLERHLHATDRHHPFASRWSTWFRPENVVSFQHVAEADGRTYMKSMVATPLAWWSSLAAIAVAAGLGLREGDRLIRTSGRFARPELPLAPGSLSFAALAIGWLSFLLPWTMTARDSYLYHFIPCHVFGLLALAGLFGKLFEARPLLLLLVLVTFVCAAAFYLPVWVALPLSFSGVDARMFLWH